AHLPSPPHSPYTTLFRSPWAWTRASSVPEVKPMFQRHPGSPPASKVANDSGTGVRHPPNPNQTRASHPAPFAAGARHRDADAKRSEEHTSELQSRVDLVC